MGEKAARAAAPSTLRTRVLLVLAGFMALLAVAGWFAFNYIVDQTALRVGALVAERQVQYDRYRGLETLRREVALAEAMVRAPNIIAWAQNEYDAEIRERGIAELEHYRRAFEDESVFLVIDGSRNYYFNDSQDSYAGDPFQYTVRSDNPRDGWYFTTRSRREGCYLNVDHDDFLGVTKVWINCIINQDGQVLGIAGTGLDLSAFIRDVVDVPQPGIESMFVDESGAVQAHRDASMVDFHSLTKDIAQKNVVFSLFDTPSDMAALRAMMATTANPDSGQTVQAAYLSVDGKPMLVGVGYLDEIGWYNVTVMDIDTIVDKGLFLPIGLLFAALMGVAVLVMVYVFKAMVLDRLEKVEGGLSSVRDGKRVQFSPDPRNDEIGRLSRALAEMSNAVTDSELGLERQIRERTEQLEALVNRDALTGVFNRRGFAYAFETMREQAYGDSWAYGLLLVDIDHFKRINDSQGHPVGDQVIVEVARRLSTAVRKSDVCARWGGDEFLILIRNCEAARLARIAAGLVEMMRSVPITLDDDRELAVTMSIGTAIIQSGDTIETATAMADAALYRAKAEGRDCVIAYDANLASAG
ncbi:GGDEF domain-containing protein [Pelagibacterium xiamenense]|uniref:GGDEF domain-containing protein n=1 Tax=Pelagibacterium xiamenense TaxID=2901140 RepID=UPI001E572777|nr:GGDEF domain-containing protein [Pelagibacterium xiamenense]MCD7060568.1 diguanylate cyclase [Pelagibacterium xiamenense]